MDTGMPREMTDAGMLQARRYSGVSMPKRSMGETSRSWTGGTIRTPILRGDVIVESFS